MKISQSEGALWAEDEAEAEGSGSTFRAGVLLALMVGSDAARHDAARRVAWEVARQDAGSRSGMRHNGSASVVQGLHARKGCMKRTSLLTALLCVSAGCARVPTVPVRHVVSSADAPT